MVLPLTVVLVSSSGKLTIFGSLCVPDEDFRAFGRLFLSCRFCRNASLADRFLASCNFGELLGNLFEERFCRAVTGKPSLELRHTFSSRTSPSTNFWCTFSGILEKSAGGNTSHKSLSRRLRWAANLAFRHVSQWWRHEQCSMKCTCLDILWTLRIIGTPLP